MINDYTNKGNGARTVIPPFPPDATDGMAYIHFQNMTEIYDPEKALSRGTLFPELDKEFLGGNA